ARPPPIPAPFPYTTLFRSLEGMCHAFLALRSEVHPRRMGEHARLAVGRLDPPANGEERRALSLALSQLVRQDLFGGRGFRRVERSEEHTSELQSPDHLVCR